MTARTRLGAAVQHERMEPWVLSWDDADDVDLTLGTFTGTASWRVDRGPLVTRAVTVGPSSTTLAWEATDTAVVGILEGEVSVTDGSSNGPWTRGFLRVIRPARGT